MHLPSSMKLEYVLFDIVILVFSWVGTLSYPKKILPRVRPMGVATAVVALFFIAWDQVVTGWWWRFNPSYTLGVFLGNLPIEEVLFFCIVPTSCLLVWVNIRNRVHGAWRIPVEVYAAVGLGAAATFSVMEGWWYTMTVSVLGVGMCVWSAWANHFLRQRAATYWMGIVVGLTLIFNGYLTARPVVLYETAVKSGMMIGTIPIEDVLYGLILVVAVGMIYERYESTGNRGSRQEVPVASCKPI